MGRIDKIIVHFLQRKASFKELEELNDWQSLSGNKETLIHYLKIWLWAGQVKKQQPVVEFDDTWSKLQRKQFTNSPKNIRIRTFWRYVAAVIILLNIGWWGATYFYRGHLVETKQLFQVTTNQHNSPVITLPDQTQVYLRKGSHLQYNSGFSKSHREVFLDGEAYFEVFHDRSNPFTVITDNARVKVLGTKFDLLADKGSAFCQTTLVEGKVEFETNKGEKYLLKPNQMIELNTKKNTVQIREVNTELFTAWKDGKVIFRDETLGEITKRLERIYNVKFIYKNPKLTDRYRFSGTFRRDTPIGDVLRMLKISIPMDVKRVEKFPEPDIIYLE